MMDQVIALRWRVNRPRRPLQLDVIPVHYDIVSICIAVGFLLAYAHSTLNTLDIIVSQIGQSLPEADMLRTTMNSRSLSATIKT